MQRSPLHKTKKIQLDKAKATMLGVIIASSMLSVFALVAGKTYLSQALYLNKVASEKTKAVKQLKNNLDSVQALTASYESFATQEPNLLGGATKGDGERDGDNGRLILDSLPSKYDFPALTTSLENSITGSDDSVAAADKTSTEIIEIPFNVTVSTNYEGIQKLLDRLEKSIRPFEITTMTVSGKNDNLQVNIAAKTYYQPEKNLNMLMKVVK